MEADDTLQIRLRGEDGETTVLKDGLKVLKDEVVDSTFMNVRALEKFLKEQIAQAKKDGVLFSVHLKATMMKVSDPELFGHVVRAFFPEVYEKYGEELTAAGLTPDYGLAALLNGLDALDPEDAQVVKALSLIHISEPTRPAA